LCPKSRCRRPRPAACRGTAARARAAAFYRSIRSLPASVTAAGRNATELAHHDRRHVQEREIEALVLAGFGAVERILHVRRGFPAEELRNVLVVGADDDHAPEVLAAIFAPIPHEKWMRGVVGVPAAVHLNERGVGAEFLFVALAELERVPRFR